MAAGSRADMRTLASPEALVEIRTRINLLSPTDQPLWGSMSVHQMLCHLTDAFRCPLGERAVPPFKPIPIPKPLFKWIALYVPIKWPHGVPAPPEIRQKAGGIPPGEFNSDRDLLLAKLDSFVNAEGLAASHPMWGPLTHREWMRWGYLHTDHHLRQFGR